MGAIGDIWVNIGMRSSLDRDSVKVKGAMSKLSGTVKQHGLMIGGAMTGIGAAMLLAGKQVDTAYADIIAGTGATGEALDDLKDSFHDVYGTIPADAKTVGNALATLNTLTGATGDTLEDLTVNIAEVSRMLGEDATQNAESFGQAMTQWGVPAEKGTALMDKLYKICQDTNIGFGDLTTQLNKYGSVMLNAGYTIEETAQMMGRLHASGMQVSRIMPGLNAAFRKWAKAGKDAKTELELTVTAIADAETSMEALAIATDTFGAEGAQRLVTAIRNNTFALDDLDTGLDDTKGLIASTAKETLTLSDKLAILKNKFTGILAPLQPLGAVMAGLGPTLMAVSMAMSMSAASAGAGTISYAQFAIAELGVAGATKVLTLALLTNPLFMGIAIGAAVIAGLYILERKFGSLTRIGKLLGIAMDNLAKYLTKVGTALNTTVVPAITNTYGKVVELSTTIKAKLAPSFERLNFVTKYWKDELVLLGGPLGLVSYEVLKLGDAFNFLTGEGEKSDDTFKDLMDTLGDLGDSSEETMSRITDSMSTISPAIADYEDAVMDAKDAQEELSEAVEETADLKGDVDNLTSAYTDLKGAIDDILGVGDDLDDQTRAITRAQKKLNEEQKSYNTLLKGVASGSKAAINAEVDLANARERNARVLGDQESTTAEIAKATFDLADAEQTYADIMQGVSKDSWQAVEANMDLLDARANLDEKTGKLIFTIEKLGVTDEHITRILSDNNIELSLGLRTRLEEEKAARSEATTDIITNLGIETDAHGSAYSDILTEVNTLLTDKTSAHATALGKELKLAEIYQGKQAKVDELKATKAIQEWARVVKAIKANPAQADIIIKKYIKETYVPATKPKAASSSSWGTTGGSAFWQSGLSGTVYYPPAATKQEGPRHKAWEKKLDVKLGEIKAHDSKMAAWGAMGMGPEWLILKARLRNERNTLRAIEPPFTAHSGGIIPEAGIYRIEMQKGEKILPLGKQQPVEQKTTIMVNVEAIINNYSDIERLELLIGESVARGIHNSVGLR